MHIENPKSGCNQTFPLRKIIEISMSGLTVRRDLQGVMTGRDVVYGLKVH